MAEEVRDGIKTWRISIVRLVANPIAIGNKNAIRLGSLKYLLKYRAIVNPRGMNPRKLTIISYLSLMTGHKQIF